VVMIDVKQGGYRLELLQYDLAGNLNMTYNLTSPADEYIGANNITYVNRRKDDAPKGSTNLRPATLTMTITTHALGTQL